MQFKMKNQNTVAILKLSYIALLTALVFVIQLLGGSIRVGGLFSITLVLLPIVLGAALVGPLGGAWLGLVFALAVFYPGDANAFLAVDPFGTVITVILKGVLAGLVTGIVYRLCSRLTPYVRALIGAAVCPIVNTGIFLLGCLVFFMPTLAEWASAFGFSNAGEYMIIGLCGINFIVELVTNILLAPVVVRLIHMLEERTGLSGSGKRRISKAPTENEATDETTKSFDAKG